MAALKNEQTGDEKSSLPTAQETATAHYGPPSVDFTKLYRQFSRNLPLNFSLQHGTRYVAVALQNGILAALAGVGWRDREKQLFAEQVAGIIESDVFVTQASDAIGFPQKDETEDEYVERGKAVFRRLLLSSLKDA